MGAVKRFSPFLFLTVLLFASSILGFIEPLNTALLDLRFRVIDHKPSDTLVVVEIDPKSLRAEERWPWPRDRYATAVSNLQDAGANLIAFDVDFSSLSDDRGDEAFVEALARRPGEVVLPVFWQWSSRSATGGEMIKTPPHDRFLNDVTVASVTLTTEENGVVRRGWRGVNDGDVYRASIASVLAGASPSDQATFLIDYSIDPKEITRLSFRDVLTGKFSAETVRRKNVLIGATALELGDEFAAPVHGVLPGVMFHAMSYESIIADRTLVRPHSFLPFVFGVALLILLVRCGRFWTWRRLATVHVTLLVATIGGPLIIQAYFPLSIDVAVILAAQFLGAVYVVALRLHQYARQVIRQKAEMAHFQALTSLVVQDNTDGVVVVDDNGCVELCNNQACALLDISDTVMTGIVITELVPDFPLLVHDDAEHLEDQGYADIGPVLQSEYVTGKNKERILEIVASRPLTRGEVAKNEKLGNITVYTLRDVSARKRIEVAEREAKEAAIAANRVKSQLISNMSHELRTPLNGVIGFADILQKESFGPLGVPEYKEYSESIYISGKRLLTVVNDMLHIAKLDSGDFELCKTEVEIDELIENAVCKFEAQAEQEQKTLTVEIESVSQAANADVSVTKEIISHLLSNAFKYTDAGGEIIVRAMQENGDLIIEVEDDGCGVEPENLPRLTEAFFQADAEFTRKYEGAGLGLYVVSRFVELHNGQLFFESSKGDGFLVCIVLRNAIVEDSAESVAA
ncbi:CHASE2 domain-containing protein [Hyphococcus flavus]|uniref:histidine kinase n=1 Tax=Hyphococcus flavus TaxID=1866326 RepID=A0AAE9ZHL8_9PROT|nr:CHASE2 domain-containing protein [Hyphococcus flavus]WDI33243.1 CHASE2 domain-containing protein [Hyphococcus flavus]